mmetsp:Transcript_22113/g.35527  ORF Transcript_22113/g.35527 Transcript_22113/m.35527 type:complete len:102 (-) Transcript_22113:280-585(-)
MRTHCSGASENDDENEMKITRVWKERATEKERAAPTEKSPPPHRRVCFSPSAATAPCSAPKPAPKVAPGHGLSNGALIAAGDRLQRNSYSRKDAGLGDAGT